LAINAGIILIRSILGPHSLSLSLSLSGFVSTRYQLLFARIGDREQLERKRNKGKERVRKRKRKAAEKSETRRKMKQAIRSRAGCVQLEEKLEICGS